MQGQLCANGQGPFLHGLQAFAWGLCDVKTDAVVRQTDSAAPVDVHQFNMQRRGACVLQDVGNRLVHHEQQMPHGFVVQMGQQGSVFHQPVHRDADAAQARLQAVTHIGQQCRHIARWQIQRVDGQLELVQPLLQHADHITCLRLAALQLAQRYADVHAHAIVHIAQNARALRTAGLLLRQAGHVCVRLFQLQAFVRHLLRQGGLQVRSVGCGRPEAHQHHHTGRQPEQHG